MLPKWVHILPLARPPRGPLVGRSSGGSSAMAPRSPGASLHSPFSLACLYLRLKLNACRNVKGAGKVELATRNHTRNNILAQGGAAFFRSPMARWRRARRRRVRARPLWMSLKYAAVVILLMAALSASPVLAARVIGGPMVGSVSSTNARVWLEISTSDHVTVRIYDVDTNQEINAIGLDVLGPPPFVADASFGGLSPDHDYRIAVAINGVHAYLPPPKLIIHTMPARKAMKNIIVAFGSCADTARYPGARIWASITHIEPRAFIFAGNSVYLPRHESHFPYTYAHALEFILNRYDKGRRFAGIQPLLRICPMYATWDDRDFGTRHSNRSFVFSKESLLAFEDYWPNPSYGHGKTLGTFCHFRIGDVSFFLLDDRSFRTARTIGRHATMLGVQQMAWLKSRLMQSSATFKVIVDGDQMLAHYPGRESWADFQPEQRHFIHWLFAHEVGGVVFLSGHRRFGELTCRKPNPDANNAEYPLYDLTSSSLAAAPVRHQFTGWQNRARIGPAVFEHNFGIVRVGGPVGARHLTLELLNSRGQVVLRQIISQAALQSP